MELLLKQTILTIATVIILAGLLAVILQVNAGVGFILASTFFIMHKIVLFQEVVSAKWKIESMSKQDNDR